jgi:hypothetical protein
MTLAATELRFLQRQIGYKQELLCYLLGFMAGKLN